MDPWRDAALEPISGHESHLSPYFSRLRHGLTQLDCITHQN